MKTHALTMSDGTKIVYDEYGNDTLTTVLLLHGNGSSARHFKRQLPTYAAHLHVIAIDSRGHGRSNNTQTDIKITDLISDIEQIRMTLHVDQVVILGYSDGANIAMKYAIQYPQHVARLVLNAPNLTSEGVYKILWWGDNVAQVATAAMAPFSAYARRRHEQLHVMSEPLNITCQQLSDLTIPTLLVIGEFDLVKRRHIEHIAEIMPHAQVMILKGHGHFVTYTNPRKFAQLVAPFLIGGNDAKI